MELRFIVEHTDNTVETAKKLYYAGDREMCILLLEELGSYLTIQIAEGVLAPPNIDVKPEKPE